jgi:hypothetical protein
MRGGIVEAFSRPEFELVLNCGYLCCGEFAKTNALHGLKGVALLNPSQFSQCIAAHFNELHPQLANQLIAVDGKTIRGSGKTNHEQQHCLSASRLVAKSPYAKGRF